MIIGHFSGWALERHMTYGGCLRQWNDLDPEIALLLGSPKPSSQQNTWPAGLMFS